MDLVVTLFVGFGGVLAGSVFTGVLDLWRQLIEGRAAARIIRMEIQENVNRALQGIKHNRADFHLQDDAWRDLRVKVAPLLPDEALLHLATGYGAIFIVEDWISRVGQKRQQAASEIQNWAEDMMLDSSLLMQTQKRRRIAQVVDLLLGRSTFPPSSKGEPLAVGQLAKMKSELFQYVGITASEDDAAAPS